MASPGNQHCAHCIGTLSFPIDSFPSPYRTLICSEAVSQTYMRLFGNRCKLQAGLQADIFHVFTYSTVPTVQ